MIDHIEAMARRWVDEAGGKLANVHPTIAKNVYRIMNSLWAAAVGAAIAHEPCGGEGGRYHYHRRVNPMTGEYLGDQPEFEPCPGPHTTITKGDGTKLHADEDKVSMGYDGVQRLVVPLPSEWRIE